MNDWKFCKVRQGTKIPYPANWQNMPLTLDQIPKNDNCGILLGELSNGTCAIDFDGPSAFEWWANNICDLLPDTIAWSSGRDGRAQFAFKVLPEYWPYLKTIKVKTGTVGDDGKHELVEFRWNGSQSILPPSIHPDTHKPYTFISDANSVAIMPDAALCWWLAQCNRVKPVQSNNSNVSQLPVTDDEILLLLKTIKSKNHTLSYPDWVSITYAVAHELGANMAEAVMRGFYLEQEPGEYKAMLRTYNREKSPTIASLVFRSKQ